MGIYVVPEKGLLLNYNVSILLLVFPLILGIIKLKVGSLIVKQFIRLKENADLFFRRFQVFRRVNDIFLY